MLTCVYFNNRKYMELWRTDMNINQYDTEPNYCVAPMCVQLCRQIRDLKSIYFNLILRYFYYADILSADDVYLWLRPNGWVG